MVEDFIKQITPLIQKYAPQYNIKVCSPIIAQAILESASGTSYKAQFHNYFGLKYRENRCPTSNGRFTDKSKEQNTDGTYIDINDYWFQFPNMEAGVIGYFDFTNISAYSNLKNVTDPETYLINIKNDKYATSQNYVQNLMNVINKYNLTQYDTKLNNTQTGYTNSSLVNYIKISPHRNSPRNHAIDTITIHTMAGNATVEGCGQTFQTREASSNYGVGSDGRIGMYVEERDRSWATSSRENDNRAVTIEVASIESNTYSCTEAAMESLIKLITDICKRNNISKLVWSFDKNQRMNHLNGCNMTVHRDYANKSCPGEYLYNNHPYIVERVNKLLGNTTISNNATTVINNTTPKVNNKNMLNFVYKGVNYNLVFDPTYYANHNLDVKKAFGNDVEKLFNHFCEYGMKEARLANDSFNVKKYRAKYNDLENAFGNNWFEYYKHFCTYGYKEKRTS